MHDVHSTPQISKCSRAEKHALKKKHYPFLIFLFFINDFFFYYKVYPSDITQMFPAQINLTITDILFYFFCQKNSCWS